ncbi:MAG: HAD family hydrolase [Terriglobales bacterium]
MHPVTILFCDIGGVFLTNGWDRHARQRLVTAFHLDAKAFERAHQEVVADFERDRIGEDEYWRRTALAVAPHGQRPGLSQLRAFMRAQSAPLDHSMALLREIAAEGRLRLVVLSNESQELNEYRIERFGLRRYFDTFLSSSYLDARKPEPVIYQRAVRILQCQPEQCAFVDDRWENLEYPRQAGWHTLHFESAAELRTCLLELTGAAA